VPDNYPTIQQAVNAASEDDTIIVRDGTYHENVNVNKSLTIHSENGSANCIVTASVNTNHVFNVTEDYVNITGFTVENATDWPGAGIYLQSVEHCNISDNNATNNYIGISLHSSSSNTLTGNTANSNTQVGIYLSSSSNSNTLTGNTASNNGWGIGLYSSSSNTLTDNTASNNTNYDFYSDGKSHNNTAEDLTIASYPTTVSFTYDNGVGLKGVTTPPPNPADKVNIGKYVNATNVTADSWLFLNVSYTDAEVSGVDEGSLKMWSYNGTAWAEVPAPNGVNTAENYVYANITSFSIFAPLGNSSGGLNCTCGDICVNETGWWHDGGIFNSSSTPIQAAVNNANEGENICVKDGTYYENVVVNVTHLTIHSENGSANCIVTALDSSDHVFNVTEDYVNITRFTVENATGSGKAGIYLGNVEHCNISDNNVTNNDYGIYLDYSSNNSLTSNTANSNNYCGILLSSSSNNTLTNNIANSNNYYGIRLYYSSNNTLTNNTANLNNKSGIWLRSSSNNTLTNNTANSNNNYGIYLSFSSNNTLTNNTANSNDDIGIYLSPSSNNTLTGNTANENGFGILLGGSSNNTLTNNTASGNTNYDFYSTADSHNNTAEDLTIASYPTTVSFTYDNGVGLKGVTSPSSDPAGKLNISKYVNATNVMADSWLFLNVSYTDEEVSGVEEGSLKLYRWNGTAWAEVPGSGVNIAENYVYANITEFSIFAPLGNPKQPAPPAAVPELTPTGLIALVGLLSVVLAMSVRTRKKKKR
jgi:parallel beta-helix repeat protein